METQPNCSATLKYTLAGCEMNSVVRVDHPLIDHHLCVVRDANTKPSEFRAAVGRLAMFLGVRATEGLTTEAITIRTPLADAPAEDLRCKSASCRSCEQD